MLSKIIGGKYIKKIAGDIEIDMYEELVGIIEVMAKHIKIYSKTNDEDYLKSFKEARQMFYATVEAEITDTADKIILYEQARRACMNILFYHRGSYKDKPTTIKVVHKTCCRIEDILKDLHFKVWQLENKDDLKKMWEKTYKTILTFDVFCYKRFISNGMLGKLDE